MSANPDSSQNSQTFPFISIEKIKPDFRKKEPPLVDLKISNPVTYLKNWWKKILGNEGLEIRIKLKPLTAIAISLIIISLTLGIGKIVLPFNIPFFEFNETTSTPIPTVSPKIEFRETGFIGELKHNSTSKKFYLIISSSEAINLIVPDTVNLSELIRRRIFATGKYYPEKNELHVDNIEDLEILPKKSEPIPTSTPTPTPTPEPNPTPEMQSSY